MAREQEHVPHVRRPNTAEMSQRRPATLPAAAAAAALLLLSAAPPPSADALAFDPSTGAYADLAVVVSDRLDRAECPQILDAVKVGAISFDFT